MRYSIILMVVSAVAFAGCRGGAGSHTEHDHGSEQHSHAAEGHEEHDHDHDHTAGDGHEAAEESHDHAEGGSHEETIAFTRTQAEAAGLEVETVEPRPFRRVIEAGGQVVGAPADEVTVAATSSGVVSFATGLTEGAAVVKGQTLLTISAAGMVEGDPAARARIELEAAEREFRRAEELVGDRIVSERDFNEARRRYLTALAAAGADATETGTGAGTTGGVRVASPVSGYVRSRQVSQGEYVTAGQAIAIVTRAGRLQLRAEVPESMFAALPSVTGANFRAPHGTAVHHADRVVSYGRVAQGGWIPVTLEFADRGGVAIGSWVEVWLLGAEEPAAISVPKSALTERQGLYFVYVRLGDEDYARREVTTGPGDGERVLVTKGLRAGDTVVTRGAVQVRLAAMSGIIPEGHSH